MHDEETDWQHGETRQGVTASGEETLSGTRIPALTILAHPDPRRVGERASVPALALGRAVQLSRLEPAFRSPQGPNEEATLPLAVRSVSREPLRLLCDVASGELTVDVCDTRTEVAVDGQVVQGRRQLSASEVEQGVVLVLGREVALLLHRVRLPPLAGAPDCGLVGESDAIYCLRHEVAQLVPLDVPVLLRGESGTGKELVARALHDLGGRRQGRFVAVNMATLSPSLAAAELFGAVRGAFTGADRKRAGLFQSAQHGTLFLDEIGETPVEVQAMLLRALDSQTIVPVGSDEARTIDVRVVAATDARLEEAMEAGRFRLPLYHRLSGCTVHLAPLRERRDDIGRLLRFFLEQESSRQGIPSSRPTSMPAAAVVARLARHTWPGNVRELRNVARRLAINGQLSTAESLARIEELLVPAATPSVPNNASAGEPTPNPTPAETPKPRRRRRNPAEVSEQELVQALEVHGYRMRDTAEALGLSRIGLYRRLEQSPNIRKAADLGAAEIEDALTAADGEIQSAAQLLRVSVQGLKRRITALRQTSS